MPGPSVTDLQARLDALRATRATGQLKVEYADRRITYKSDAEMAAAIHDLERQIATAQASRICTILVVPSKGL